MSAGFLEHRQIQSEGANVLPFVCPRRVDRRTRDVQVGMVYWVHLPRLGHCPMSYFTESDSLCPSDGKPTTHTAQRGWCLQERLLSTRSLIFTTQTLQLRCHSLTQNIGGAHHDDSNDVPRLPDAVFHPDQHIARGSNEWNNIHGRWLKIVEDYSFRKLSDPSDKLTAISALAEMFAPTLGPDYVAGLWRRTLLEDLLWESQSSGLASPGSGFLSGYRAPSWSWASIDGPVRFWHNTTGVPIAEVVECTLLLRNKQLPFGPVISGSLVLSASLLRCRRSGRYDIEVDADTPSYPSPTLTGRRFTCTANFDYEDDDAVREIWIIPIMQVGIFYNTMQGLVVTREEVDAWGGGVFRRVAICSFGDFSIASEWMGHGIPRVNIELV